MISWPGGYQNICNGGKRVCCHLLIVQQMKAEVKNCLIALALFFQNYNAKDVIWLNTVHLKYLLVLMWGKYTFSLDFHLPTAEVCASS